LLDLPDWKSRYRHDPIQPLLESKFEAIGYCASRDLLGEEVEPITLLWDLPEPKALLRRQRDDGSWRYPGKNPERYPDVNYSLLETFKRLRLLVGKYGLDRSHPQIEKAAEYMFSCQSDEGDFRGIYADQYAPHYTGIFSESLIKAGYHDDPRMDRCLEWLLSVRMDDGGWAHSLLTQGLDWSEQTRLTTEKSEPMPFDKSKPFSNNVTGMALRAFACHPTYKHAEEAKKAGGLLATRFFKPNVYSSYRAADNWVRFQYPFWWNNVLMALDSLSLLGFGIDHRKVKEALDWFVEHQCEDGLWENSYKKKAKRIDTERAREGRLWITLAVCRVFKRLHE
jgi:hypothetical protein